MSDDELVQVVLNVIKNTRLASISEVQRKLLISHDRAARMMEMLEERGIVGHENGYNPREILVDLNNSRRIPSSTPRQMAGPASEAVDAIQKMITHKGGFAGMSTGFTELDMLTHGFRKKEMIVLAAHSTTGKFSLALSFAETAALPPGGGKGAGVLIFSLEMGAEEIATRMLCSRARVNMRMLRQGLLSKNGGELDNVRIAADELGKAPIYIDEPRLTTIMELRAKARSLAFRLAGTQTPLGFIIVDDFQLLWPADFRVSREEQIADLSYGLKSLAKELNVPVLVLSRFDRVKARIDRVPRVSLLPSALVQEADVVLMLAQPKDAYGKYQVAVDSLDLEHFK